MTQTSLLAFRANSRIASSDAKSLNHHFSSASIATGLWKESKMDDFRITGSTYMGEGGARSEGGDVSRKEANVPGCAMSLRESGLGPYECF